MRVLVLILSLLLPGLAQAATLTFDGLPAGGAGTSWQEAGYVVTANPGGTSGSLGLADGGSAQQVGITAAEPGGLFAALGLSLSLFRQNYYAFDGMGGLDDLGYDNVLVRGYLDGALVAESLFSSDAPDGQAASWTQLSFGAAFGALDLLTITALFPTEEMSIDGGDKFCSELPCASFRIDDLVLMPTPLSPVPLPAGAPLLALGLGALWLARRRHRAG